MSKVIDEAVTRLAAKMRPDALPGIVKFVLTDEGAIMLDASGVREGDRKSVV